MTSSTRDLKGETESESSQPEDKVDPSEKSSSESRQENLERASQEDEVDDLEPPAGLVTNT